RVVWNRVMEARPGLAEPVDLGLDEEEVKKLDALFGRHGTEPWTGLNTWELLREIEQLWPNEEGRKQLWWFYGLAHRANNQKLHLSAFSLNRVVRAREEHDGAVVFQIDASPSIDPRGPVGPALYGALW